ncbi:MAG: hypothetical protein Q7S88_01950 [Candidatus Daviesbacteria bacterium]|nr:hypothetical protein [Candidatus Daviesbacteria bacterium]
MNLIALKNLPTTILGNKKLLLALGLVVILLGGLFLKNYLTPKVDPSAPIIEEELTFDPEGPYVQLLPRNDGNALNLTLKRIARYESLAYELAYTDEEGVSRGVGDKNTWIKIDQSLGEYEQEVLFGTCSKNVCKYDKGVENGSLSLWVRLENHSYRVVANWHLQSPESALGKLVSPDEHLSLTLDPKKHNLALVKFTIIHDLSGAPKISSDKRFVGKVYTVNTPLSKSLPSGEVKLELAEIPPQDAKIAVFSESDNKWNELETKVSGSILTATAPSGGIFAVLALKN